jgi:2-polyprenyl-3-methyl-5-hydroxy-6-metoxy-1,4-benzoquinol methylase
MGVGYSAGDNRSGKMEPISITSQSEFWNKWNASTREKALNEVSYRQASVVTGWLDALERWDLDILEVGCGAGWLCGSLSLYGRVTATDLSDAVLARASRRLPEVRFVPGDFMALDFDDASYDVIVTLEVLSHMGDQPAFIARLARLLRPGGHLMMATQNAPVLRRWNRIPPPEDGQIRQWVDRRELTKLLDPHFHNIEIFSVTPIANRGLMRLANSRTVNRPIRALIGDRLERVKERLDLGWTLMAQAHRR